MRGTVQRRGKGSWRVRASAGFHPITGKRVEISRSVKGTRRDAEHALTALLREIDTGNAFDPGRITMSDLVSRYLDHTKTRVRPRTLLRYSQLLNQHVLPQIGAVKLAKLRPAHVQALVDNMVAHGLASRTVLHGYRVLSAVLRQALRWQLIGTNPAAAIRPPRPERPQLTIPDPEMVKRIIRAVEGTSLHAPILVAASSGLRRGELLGLTWASVNLDSGLVRVIRTAQTTDSETKFMDCKTDRSRRTVALPPFAIEVLRKHRREQAERRLLLGPGWVDLDLVFDRGDGHFIEPDLFTQRFQRLAAKLKLPVRLHDLRHAYATALLIASVHPKVVSEALGHSSVAFTLDTYSHVLPTMQEASAAAIQKALGDGF
jgi:integrase